MTTIVEREDDSDVALCPDLHAAIQGTTVLEARDNLKEALGSFLQTASDSEIKERLNEEVYGTGSIRQVDRKIDDSVDLFDLCIGFRYYF